LPTAGARYSVFPACLPGESCYNKINIIKKSHALARRQEIEKMRKFLMLVAVASLCAALAAQQYTTKNIGKVSTINSIDVTVTVDSAGTIILSTPGHSIYVYRRSAPTFGSSLEAILAGMRSIDAKGITLVDYRVVGRLGSEGWAQGGMGDGIMFHLQLNPSEANRVLLLMYSTRDLQDLIFTTSAVAQLSDLVKKAMSSGTDYGDQYEFVQTVLDRIETSILR